jgi:hypothetical protein
MSSEGYSLETASGLHAFNMEGEYYVFLPALAQVVNTSTGNISVLLGRHPSLKPGEGDPQIVLASNAEMPTEWQRLVKTFQIVKVKLASGGEYKRKKLRAPQNLTLYPLKVCLNIVRHYTNDVDAAVTSAVEKFWLEVRPDQAGVEESKDSGLIGVEIGQDDSVDVPDELGNDDLIVSGRMKREPASYLEFPTIMRGLKIVIDLTKIGEGDDAGSENVDSLQAQLSDKFLAACPHRA